MVVVMMTLHTGILAERITHHIVAARDRMDQTLLQKGLQSAVNSHPIETAGNARLQVVMR